MDIIFQILNSKKIIISSNLPSDYSLNKENVVNKIKQEICQNTGKNYRHGFFKKEIGSIYLASSNKNITNRIFNQYFEACFFFLPKLIESEKEFREKEQQNFRRLKHNLITHNTNVLQELEKNFPIDKFPKGGKKQIEFINNEILQNTQEISMSILKIMKSANLMKSDFDVYDMLISKNPYLEFDLHNIHKIILQIINLFWLEFIEKKVFIDISDCHEKVYIDYKSISVVFTHLLENAVKYIAPDSTLEIYFENLNEFLVVYLRMTSVKITENDKDKLFKSNYSGDYSKKLGTNGSGLGLNVVKQLLSLNEAKIDIRTNINHSENKVIDGIPFEQNKFYIKLRKGSA